MKALRATAHPAFRPGDTLKVNVKVVDVTYDEKAKQNKTRERLQAFEGVCIARQGQGINESFTVRKISYGEGVERVFPVYSPLVNSVLVVRKGRVRRAKLYYLRGRRANPPVSPSAWNTRTPRRRKHRLAAQSKFLARPINPVKPAFIRLWACRGQFIPRKAFIYRIFVHATVLSCLQML